MALTAAVSLLALFALASQASAQDGPSLTADPPAVPAEGEYTFTISGSGFTAGLALFVLPCTAPGEPMTPDNVAAAIAAIGQTDCNLGSMTPVVVGADGTFSLTATATVGQNFVWIAGDAAQTEAGAVPVFIVEPMDDMGDDMGDDMAPEGAAETGFGGTAGSDGNSVAVPLAATLAAVALLGGTALVARRHS
ncbi:MAG: hypothetical protein F4Y99_13380 [Acidimicrobiaceae bacterium]|nr:hypothetical protein [Acidimicrobiaceae bacterium]MDE0516760.1 hypothetical protein [Acidimicrobiaceae bacterium]MXZ96905.1 hypothetical protein [Acidimicrobiaceae bacterium]MYF42943.1 hypothetical protein [Acidimicrobiaceae bacterium]MYJ36345.1 hypothetical protein [Acidimicrobiaceae bacterium]